MKDHVHNETPSAGGVSTAGVIIGFAVAGLVLVAGVFAFSNQSTSFIDSGAQSNDGTSTASTTPATSTPPSASPVVGAVATTTPTTPTHRPTASTGRTIGIAAGSGISKLGDAELNRQLDAIVELGATWVRFDIEWGLVQYNSPEHSTWERYDRLVDAINARGLNALGVIVFTPEWARAQGCGGGAKCPPKDPAAYALFASQVVARYTTKGVHAWEIWNEPNSYDFWATKTDCHAYTALLKATYPAIKRVDPGATVITGGTAPLNTDKNNISQIDFMQCVYKDGGKGYFDAVAIHPYTFPALPSSGSQNAWARMAQTAPSIRSIMVENGDGNKKIWITEFGVPTNGPDAYWYVSEDTQVKTVEDAIRMYRTYSWAGPLFWYSIKDNGAEKTTNENFFGLVRADGSHKPAFEALKKAISAGL